MHLAGDARLLLLAHAFQVRRQLAQLRSGLLQLQLGLLVAGDVPDHAVPGQPAAVELARGGLDVDPARLAAAGEDASLPVPVAAAADRFVLAGQVAVAIVRMHQADDAGAALAQVSRRIAEGRLAAAGDEADVGEVRVVLRLARLQAEHQAGHVGGDALQARLALLQGLARTAAFGDVGEEHQQVFGFAKAQEAQRDVGRQPLAIAAQAADLEAQRPFLVVARTAPEVQPAVHVHFRLQRRQRPLVQLAGAVAEHFPGGAVGVADVAVPVDPEDADRAVVEGELGQAQFLFGGVARLDVPLRRPQAPLHRAALALLPGEEGQRQRQQHAEQQAQAAPERRRFAETRVLRLQPALVHAIDLLGRNRAQGQVDHFRQLRQVAAGGDPQQLGIADVGEHGEAGELGVLAETRQLRLVDHGEARLAGEHLAQRRAVALHRAQGQRRIGAAQVFRHRAGPAQRHRFAGAQLLHFHRAAAAALADQQARHPQVGIGKQPVAQAGGRLADAGGEIDAAVAGGPFQRRRAVEDDPLQPGLQPAGEAFQQFHVRPGQLLGAAVLLHVGRFQHHADAQRGVGIEPGALLRVQCHAGRLHGGLGQEGNEQQQRQGSAAGQTNHADGHHAARAARR
ncbi:hypothetical protein D9M71_115020 [compost metagenome]